MTKISSHSPYFVSEITSHRRYDKHELIHQALLETTAPRFKRIHYRILPNKTFQVEINSDKCVLTLPNMFSCVFFWHFSILMYWLISYSGVASLKWHIALQRERCFYVGIYENNILFFKLWLIESRNDDIIFSFMWDVFYYNVLQFDKQNKWKNKRCLECF